MKNLSLEKFRISKITPDQLSRIVGKNGCCPKLTENPKNPVCDDTDPMGAAL
ncbi:hypothetical protein ACFQ1M_14725 [Sungkyunkwania multivorans]|uniref:Uncharacterized protein n=1 Tax=Sungkyunkwania multivorans TaxID=1173618 RepID=A0ABW3D2D9_9FLAO